MKTTKVLTIQKLYDFELQPWEAHGSQFVTLSGEAISDDGTTYCWTNNCKLGNEDRRGTDLSNLIECEAQYFVHDEGKATGKGVRSSRSRVILTDQGQTPRG